MQEEKPTISGAVRSNWKQYNKGQKIAFVAFIVCALFLLFLSAASVQDGIRTPFMGSVADLIKKKDLLKDPVTEQENYAKRTDTDGDGLSDYSEENVYKTSPYLWSTAGDDVPDNVKIALGENPLCKHGEKCTPNPMRFDLGTTTLPYAGLVQNQNTVQDISGYLTGNNKTGDVIRAQAGAAGETMDLRSSVSKDPAVIRQALLDSGKVKKEDLDKLTDEQLMKMVDEAITETEAEQKKSGEKYIDQGVVTTTPSGAGKNQLNATST